MKKRINNKIFMLTFAIMLVISSFAVIESKSAVVPERTTDYTNDTTYSTNFYAEAIEVFPFRNTAAGVHGAFIGGSTNLPFDLNTPELSQLQAFSLVVANQKIWRNYAPRRFWDIADGATLVLIFKGDPDTAIDNGRALKETINSIYNFNLNLVYGEWKSEQQITLLVYQSLVSEQALEDFTGLYPSYVSNDGLGEGITVGTLLDTPVKAMSVSLYRGAAFRSLLPQDFLNTFPLIGLTTNFIPVTECAWIDPDGLVKTDTIIEMNLTRLMPGFTDGISPAANSRASFVGMKLPYVVDVLEIYPPTSNRYAHLKGEFEWALKLDAPLISFAQNFEDIYVKYDLNITGLTHFPQVIGEMSLNPASILTGGGDIIYDFTFTNVGNEAAYNITTAYGAFATNETSGIQFEITNPDVTFDENQIMYYDNDTYIFSDTDSGGLNVFSIEGWFFNDTEGDWVKNGETIQPDELQNILDFVYVNETFLEVNPMDFALEELDNETSTLTATIAQLNPGENTTLSFAIENLPTGTIDLYEGNQFNETHYQISVNTTVDLEELIILLLQLGGSTLHIPEDQVTWANWFPQPVMGNAFFYEDADGVEFSGLTNGMVIQLYDDEAILIGTVSLDKDVYRFNEDVVFTLELENVGNANATNINYTFYHAFLTEDFNIPWVEQIPGSEGYIALIEPGEKETVQFTHPATTAVGLHPVFAIFNYTSDETTDPTHPDIFSSVDHPAVFSNLDFGIILPPVSKEGTTEAIYPTPEVEVTTEIIGYEANETTIGDTITLRSTITNVGDEATNIIYQQYIPRRLEYVDDTLSVTVEDEPVDYTLSYFAYQPNIELANYNPYMPAIAIYDEKVGDEIHGIPLGINETLVIEADFTITSGRGIEEVDWTTLSSEDLVGLYIPPAEVRYFSEYEIQDTGALNSERATTDSVSTEDGNVNIASAENVLSLSISNEQGIDNEWATTNSWGSYGDSLSLLIADLSWLGNNGLYFGIGIIAVTGIAVLIYFRANGKRK